jgi:hypothetical protein
MSNLVKRAAIVGGMDAAGALISAGLGAKIADTTVGKRLTALALSTVAESASGAAGEAGAEVATGQPLQPGQIIGEAIGELPSGVVELPAAAAGVHAGGRAKPTVEIEPQPVSEPAQPTAAGMPPVEPTAAEAPPPGQPVTPTEPAPPPPGAAPAGRPPTPGAALPLRPGVDTSPTGRRA